MKFARHDAWWGALDAKKVAEGFWTGTVVSALLRYPLFALLPFSKGFVDCFWFWEAFQIRRLVSKLFGSWLFRESAQTFSRMISQPAGTLSFEVCWLCPGCFLTRQLDVSTWFRALDCGPSGPWLNWSLSGCLINCTAVHIPAPQGDLVRLW